MDANYHHLITMEDYDNAKTPEEKRAIAKGFEDCRNATLELNVKYIAELQRASGELATFKECGTLGEIKASLRDCMAERPYINLGANVYFVEKERFQTYGGKYLGNILSGQIVKIILAVSGAYCTIQSKDFGERYGIPVQNIMATELAAKARLAELEGE